MHLHTALYAALGMSLLLALCLQISLIRLRLNIFIGDGGVPTLQAATRAHGTSVEHLVPSLLLLLILELCGAEARIVDGLGIAILSARLVQVGGFLSFQRVIRTLGATLTYLVEAGLIVELLRRVS